MRLRLLLCHGLRSQRRTRQSCVALVLLCMTVCSLILWTHLHVVVRKPSVILPKIRVEVAQRHLLTYGGGSTSNAPCLTSRLFDLDCRRLVHGDEPYVDYLLSRTEWIKNGACQQYKLEDLVADCDALKSRHGYYRWPVTRQEEDFPLAFGLKVHHAPDMVERLLRVIWRPHNFYCVHVDKKSPDEVYQAIQNLTQCFDNVFMSERRHSLVYLTASSIYSDMECMGLALRSRVPWKYYLNLSGQEFPLKTNLELVQILTLLNGTNDIESYPTPKSIRKWYNRMHIVLNGTLRRTKTSKEPFRYPIYLRKGSAYGSFSRQFLEFAFTDQISQELLAWLDDTWAPDELYWATLNYLPGVPGSVYGNVTHNDSTMLSRAVVWYWDDYKCRGVSVHAICVYSAFDLPWLTSRPEFIANKFDNARDPIVLDCLEQFLENRTASTYRKMASPEGSQFPFLDNLNWTFYLSLPQVQRAWPQRHIF